MPQRRRVWLERPSLRREEAFLAAVRRSRALHGVFVEAPSTRDDYARYLRRQRRPTQVCFLVVERASDELVGVVNINDIVRDSRDSGSLGYYAFEPFAGLGLMREALGLVVAFAFRELKLHRLEANIQPSNERSIRLADGLGFSLEGTSRRYLKIRGRWRDHQRWALLAEDWRLGRQAGHHRARREAARRCHAQASSTTSTADGSRRSAATAARRPSVNATRRP
jgi:[ribosomal protein S5]-alanine N-acetyltransferase